MRYLCPPARCMPRVSSGEARLPRGPTASGVDVTDSHPLDQAVTSAQCDLAASIDRASLRNDPYSHLLRAMSLTIGLFPEFLREMRDTADQGRLPLDPAALARLEQAAAEGASRAAAGLVRVQARRSALGIAAALVTCLVGGASGGYWWGHGAAIRQFSTAEAGFSALVHDDPSAAAGWLALVRNNDYAKVMRACAGASAFSDKGRRACLAPVWLDDVQAAEAPHAKP